MSSSSGNETISVCEIDVKKPGPGRITTEHDALTGMPVLRITRPSLLFSIGYSLTENRGALVGCVIFV